MDRLQLFNAALEACKKLLQEYPHDFAIRSVVEQLKFLIDLQAGNVGTRERLREITIGVLTVREIEPIDPGTADILYKVVEEIEAMEQE